MPERGGLDFADDHEIVLAVVLADEEIARGVAADRMWSCCLTPPIIAKAPACVEPRRARDSVSTAASDAIQAWFKPAS